MTYNYNNFKINKMMVFSSKKCVLNIDFYNGLNIIFGKNSAGKSSILDVLAYSLGAEEIEFNQTVEKFIHVNTELQIGNSLITVRREIKSNSSKTPLKIFFGKIENTITSQPDDWQIFPYSSYESKFGFSSILFEYLNYAKPVSNSSNLTMHQLLRILYADQKNTFLPIFRYEKWDKGDNRVAILDYILGIFNGELYSLQTERKDLTKKSEQNKTKLSLIKGMLHSFSKLNENKNDLVDQKNCLIESKNLLLEKVKSPDTTPLIDQTNLQNPLRENLTYLNKEIIHLNEEYINQELELVDLQNFYDELKVRSIEINESISSNKLISNIIFDFCPCCHNKLPLNLSVENECRLCGNESSENISKNNLLQMKTELNFQIQETSKLLSQETNKFRGMSKLINNLTNELKRKEQEFDIISSLWHTKQEATTINSYQKISDINIKLINIDNDLKVMNDYEILENEQNQIKSRLGILKEEISELEASVKNKKISLLKKLQKNLRQLLLQDIGLQTEFSDINSKIDINFEENRIYINQSSNFSQSSTIVLRHLFHLSLLMLADSEESIRLPRFFILDGLNDGGMEYDRAINLQNIIINTCKQLKRPFQVICATSITEIPTDNKESFHKIEYLDGKKTFDID